MSSFWLILKQQWTIDEISIFSNSSHLEWRAGLSDTILKGTHPRTIPARFGLIWFRGFRGEDLNVKVYDVWRMPSDGKSSHGLWPGELKKQKQVWFTCLTRVFSFLPTLYVTVSSTFNQVPGDRQLFIYLYFTTNVMISG